MGQSTSVLQGKVITDTPVPKPPHIDEKNVAPPRNESQWYNSPYAMNIWTKPPPSPWYPVGVVKPKFGGRRYLLEEQQIDKTSFFYRVIVPQLGLVIQLYPRKVRGVRRLLSGEEIKIKGLKGNFVVYRS